MSGKYFFITVVFLFSVTGFGEIFKTSAFQKMKGSVNLKRDIFNIRVDSLINKEKINQEKRLIDEKKKIQEILEKKAQEQFISQDISYEGYIFKAGICLCLMKINGEYFLGKEGDLINGNVTLLRVEKKKLKVKIQGKELDVFIREQK